MHLRATRAYRHETFGRPRAYTLAAR
jgi:hypothetical protein